MFDLNDARFPAQHGQEIQDTSSFTGRKTRFTGRPDSVGADAHSNHVKRQFRIKERAGSGCCMNERWFHIRLFHDCQGLLKAAELELGERWIEGVLNVRKMSVNSLNLYTRHGEEGAREIFQLVDADTLAVRARLDLDMNIHGLSDLFRRTRQSLHGVTAVNHLAIAVARDAFRICWFCMAQDCDRLSEMELSQNVCFSNGINAEPIGSFGGYRSKFEKPVPVGIRFYDDHQSSARRRNVLKRRDVRPKSVSIQLYPRQHETIIPHIACYTSAVKGFADVLIIGGGVIGSSIAYNLKADGFGGRVAVLERDPSYQFASSALAMGGVREQYMSRVNVQMAQYSIALYERTAVVDFHQRGYLFLGNQENWTKLQQRYEIEKSLGVSVEILGVSEIRSLVPELRLDDIVGGIIGRRDGYLDPRKVLRFLRETAEQHGAVYIADELQRIDIARGAVKGVHLTRSGWIAADRLVIAAGAHSGVVGEIAGIHIPVTPVRQQLFRCGLPRRWSYEFPMTVDPGGVHWRSSGDNEITIAKTNPRELPGFRYGADLERFHNDFKPDLIRRLPEFKDLKLVFGWGGLYEMTPDQNGIIDAHPAIYGLYLACGFSGHGLMTSPATGKLISELIRLGRFETIDASPLSYSRFERNQLFFDEAML